MSFDNNSFYDDNSTKNWQPQPTPMEDRRRRHTGKWITAIVILGLLALAVTGTVHLVRDVGVTLNRSDTGFLLTVGTQPAQTRSNRADADSKGNGTVRSGRSACADAAGRRGAAAADDHAVARRRADRRLR